MASTAYSYAALSRRLDGIAPLAESWVFGFCGYSKKDVAWRFLQRCTELGVFRYTKISAEEFQATGSFPSDDSTIDCGGLRFISNRQIRVSPSLFVRALLEYIVHWTHALVAVLLSLRFHQSHSRFTLLYGVGMADLTVEGSDHRFLDFCCNGNVEPLTNYDKMAVQATQPIRGTCPSRVRYGRFPLFLALGWRGLPVREWVRALRNHLVAMWSFVSAVICSPGLILLGRDAAYHAIAESLSRVGALQNIVLTNSNYFSQALWMWALPHRKHRLHLVWYSQNNYPVVYADDPVIAPIPNLRFVKADTQWVWTCAFKRFLVGLGSESEFKVIGPILWHLPSSSMQRSQRLFKVAVFDVTPIDRATERLLGLVRSYYTNQTMTKFISDVVEISRRLESELGRKIEIVLKHKRIHGAIHAESYLSVVRELAKTNQISILPPTTNLYDLIDSCDAVIAAPFSSPAYVGIARGRPTAWYDSTGSLCPIEDDEGICHVSGGDALGEFIRRACKEKCVRDG
ncbi:MAG: polysaccharide biosynthesis PFTS motif protein [Nitrospira sp.]|nr:polysaccharide biosynthesis PFTS motif protein [Nitrospira sp.]